MLDDSGRLIHIDFGFLLTNAPGRLPGGVGFESAPMKVGGTIDVMKLATHRATRSLGLHGWQCVACSV